MRKRVQLARFLYEKVVLAITIALISGTMIYMYNAYSKAFEVAQAQSRGYSTLGLRLRELALDNSIKSSQEIRSVYIKSDAVALPKESANEIENVSIQIEAVSKLLAGQLKDTVAIARDISRILREAVLDFSSGVSFTRSEIDRFDGELTTLQSEFIVAYNREIGDLTINEFKTFFDRFSQEIPFFLRPHILIFACLGLFGIATALLVILWMREPEDEMQARSGRRSSRTVRRSNM